MLAIFFMAQDAGERAAAGGIDWALTASWAVAGAAVLGLLFREFARSRENLDTRVSQAVNAAIGQSLQEFGRIGQDVREEIDRVVGQSQERLREEQERGHVLAQRLELQLEQLEGKLEVAEQLEELLQRGDALLPSLDASTALQPNVLIQHALMADDIGQGTALLSQLLDIPQAASADLESAGDIARQKYNALQLAERLYGKAVEADPRRVTSQAEFLAIRIERGAANAEEIVEELRALAMANPNNDVVTARLTDTYSRLSDYEGMLDYCRVTLESSPDNSILHRNAAIAMSELDYPPGAISESYEAALAIERRKGRNVSNIVRPYSSFVMNVLKDTERAEELVVEGLRADPTESQLYISLADIYSQRGDNDMARRLLARSLPFCNPREAIIAQQMIQRIEAFELLQDLLPSLEDLGPRMGALPADRVDGVVGETGGLGTTLE